jgi:HJR/Mrr/RecB family endonuclease
MKSKCVRNIAGFIYSKFYSEELLIVNWILKNKQLLIENIDDKVNEEELYETICDTRTQYYETLVNCLKKAIDHHAPSNRVCIREDIDGIFISLSELGSRIDPSCEKDMYKKFKQIEIKEKMEKGLIYETFCTKFLGDLGLEAEKTKASNDKGIDIIAKYKSQLPNPNSSLVFDDYIYLIGQAKFYNSKVDTPIIRKLVGDSLFIRFDQLEYLQLSHNAIHLFVFSHKGFTDNAIDFCTRNKVMRIDTTQMISIITSLPNPEETTSFKYLKGIDIEE